MWALVHLLCFRSVAQSCPTLCNPMERSTPGLPVPHQLPEFTQTHVHRVSDAIQPSHPLSSPSPPAFNLSQHQGLFQGVSSSQQVAEGLELTHIYIYTNSRWCCGEELSCQCRKLGDACLIPGSGRSPGGGHGNPLQYSCLESPMDGGAWRATVHGVAESQTQLSN